MQCVKTLIYAGVCHFVSSNFPRDKMNDFEHQPIGGVYTFILIINGIKGCQDYIFKKTKSLMQSVYLFLVNCF